MSLVNPDTIRIATTLLLLVPVGFSSANQAKATLQPAVESRQPDADDLYLAIENFVNSAGEQPIAEFIDTWVDKAFVQKAGRIALTEQLQQVRKACGNPGGIMIEPGPSDREVLMIFESSTGRWQLALQFNGEPARRIAGFSLSEGHKPDPIAPFTWDSVAQRLKHYETEGFAGSVMLVRGGEVLLNEGYGFANESLGARNSKDTLFAVGSTPIDFTHVAILFLEECGRLSTGDLLSKYVDGVPPDKSTITLAHLMSGRSGLRNFHGIRGLDENLDLSYIDREEALRRILGSPLLFAPGFGNEHSHSAWGVLAAVVEIVSEQTYEEFIEENLFEPAGMTSTGMYPHSTGFDDKLIAVGAGEPALGKPNSPKNWGPTSWLVMGSGGMVSTTQDFYRWLQALRADKILSPEQQKKYFKGQILSGGNDRGFMTLFTEGPDDLVILCSNSSVGMDDLSWEIAYALADLVRGVPSQR